MTKDEATSTLLRIVTARTYIGEEVFINNEGKFAFRPSTALEAAYQWGQRAKAYWEPRKNPYKLGSDEWGEWAKGYDGFDMPSPDELDALKQAAGI